MIPGAFCGPSPNPNHLVGTLMRLGVIGGPTGGAAFDARSEWLVLKTTNQPSVARIIAADHGLALLSHW